MAVDGSRIAGKVVIITGAASGIGLACARRFAAHGAKVVLADINEAEIDRLAKDFQDQGFSAIAVHCDVAQRFDVRNLVAQAIDSFARIDVLINNAAIIDSAPFLELAEEEFDRVIDTNLKGYFLTGQAVAKQMVAQLQAEKAADPDTPPQPGTIINISSVNAVFALPEHVAYSVSKGGVAQLTRAMALALAEHRIRVNAIGPGSIRSPMLEQVAEDDAVRAAMLSQTPLGRFGEPDEIASIAVFLASEAASYITGQTIYADGGRLPLNDTIKTR